MDFPCWGMLVNSSSRILFSWAHQSGPPQKHEKKLAARVFGCCLDRSNENGPASLRGRMRTMFASTIVAVRKVNILALGNPPTRFRSFGRRGEIRCQWHFVWSHEEVPALLRHTALDIVISTYTHQSHTEVMALLTGTRQ